MLSKPILSAFCNLLVNKPVMAVWNITDNCNFNCLYCNSHKIGVKNPEFEKIINTLKHIKDIGISHVYLQGGEPTIHKNIIEILKEILSAGLKPTIITNGSFLTDNLINFIKDKDINLSISIPTLDAAKYYEFTGVNNCNYILEKLRSLKNIKHKGNWSIGTTVTRMNYKEISEIEKFALENNFMYAIRSYMYGIGSFGKEDLSLSYEGIKEEVIKIFQEFASKEYNNNFFSYLVYSEHVKYLQGNYATPCDAIRRYISINSNGSFSPCIEMPFEILGVDGENIYSQLTQFKDRVEKCYKETPCFYGCGRNIGVLYNSKKLIFKNPYRVIKSVIKYGTFF